ncbi:MAG: hypothetical protein A2X39_04955 [Elusimicrobia bacterium GWC2_56_31]|nr:MAG: hypothetical protein A2X39_04955 [Elusimicrobia bacterium GWC2_56_31]HBB67681.1 hypothetical protein [Elusimicrobiota bacterium]HBW22863.1 hypothetical protein [Elusimicrobiota bacterium]
MKYKAVLFDFDGVIGRTTEDNYLAWARAFRAVGIRLGKKDYFLNEGLDPSGVAVRELAKNGRPADQAGAIINLKEKFYRQNNRFKVYPGIPGLVRKMKQKYKLAVVTGAGRERFNKTMPAGLRRCFSVLVSGGEAAKPKPSPEPYLAAARKLRVSEADCLVVENAPLGIEAAKKAKMACVAITSTLAGKWLSRADYIVKDVKELGELIEKLEKVQG